MTPTHLTHIRVATVHEPEAATVHTITITAENEPLLLARILQKFAVPDIELLTVKFTAGEPNAEATAEVRFRTAPARALLTAAKLRKLIFARRVDIAWT